jgi:hypothetical protein
MRYRHILWSSVAALFLSAAPEVLGASGRAWAQGAPSKGSKAYIDPDVAVGRELVQKGNYNKAREHFLKAWKRKQSYDLAGNLGDVALELKMPRDAAEHLTYCVENSPALPTAHQEATLTVVRALLKTAREMIGVARLRVTRDDGKSAEGAQVFVNGRLVGKVIAGGHVKQPLLSTEDVFVDDGSSRYSAVLEDCADAEAVLSVAKGKTINTNLVLSCKKRISVPWVIAGTSAAVVGIGFGIGGLVYSSSRRDDGQPAFDMLKSEHGPTACSDGADKVKCDELASAVNDWNVFRGIGIGGFALAGVGVAIATGALLWPSAPKSSNPRVEAAFSVVPGGGGAMVRGSF